MSSFHNYEKRETNLKKGKKAKDVWSGYKKASKDERVNCFITIGVIVNAINNLESELDYIINKKGTNVLELIEDFQRYKLNLTSKVWVVSSMIKNKDLQFIKKSNLLDMYNGIHDDVFNTSKTTIQTKKDGINRKQFVQLLEHIIRIRNSVAHNPFVIETDFKAKECHGYMVINKDNGKGTFEMCRSTAYSEVEKLMIIVSPVFTLMKGIIKIEENRKRK